MHHNRWIWEKTSLVTVTRHALLKQGQLCSVNTHAHAHAHAHMHAHANKQRKASIRHQPTNMASALQWQMIQAMLDMVPSPGSLTFHYYRKYKTGTDSRSTATHNTKYWEMVNGLHLYSAFTATSGHPKRFTILPHNHPFIHTFTHRRRRKMKDTSHWSAPFN